MDAVKRRIPRLPYKDTHSLVEHGVSKYKERNDCTVRALAAAMNISYDNAHDHMAKYGRKHRHGMYTGAICNALRALDWEVIDPFDLMNQVLGRDYGQITINQLLKHRQKGRMYVLTRGHALAVVDGVVHDSHAPSKRTRVQLVLKPKDEETIVKMKVDKKQETWDVMKRGTPNPAGRTMTVAEMINLVSTEVGISKANARYYVVRVHGYPKCFSKLKSDT